MPADQYSTCPKHMVLKPCPHCDPSHSQYASKDKEFPVCRTLSRGEVAVVCDCGGVRPAGTTCSSVSWWGP